MYTFIHTQYNGVETNTMVRELNQYKPGSVAHLSFFYNTIMHNLTIDITYKGI